MPDRQVVEWDKDDIDVLKMMKVDILGLGMLGCMQGALTLLKDYKGITGESDEPLQLHEVPKEDPETYRMIQKADTLGVLQIESRAQMSMLPRLRPHKFYDLVVQIAIVRTRAPEVSETLARQVVTLVQRLRTAEGLLKPPGVAETLDWARALESLGTRQLDVGDPAACRDAVAACVEDLGRLDVLGNVAGIFVTTHAIDLTVEQYRRVMAVNLDGPFFLAQAAIPHLLEAGGNIVNIASVAGVAGSGSSIAYAASKGAVITLTKSLARAFAPEVRVNAVAPGPVQTRWLADHQDMVDQAMTLTPMKRPATADDIADVTLFLADGTSLMTGQVLVADGGRTI